MGLSLIYLELYFIARFLLAGYIRDLPHKTYRSAISGVWQLVDKLRRYVLKYSKKTAGPQILFLRKIKPSGN